MSAPIITPRDAVTDERLALSVGPDDYAKVQRGPDWRAIVTDLSTGKRYAIQGAPCSIPTCYCDAVAMELPAEPGQVAK